MKFDESNLRLLEDLIVRIPVFSLNNYYRISEKIISEIYNNDVLLEAIFVSSPQLYKSLRLYQQNQNGNIKVKKKLIRSLGKYLRRAVFRSTPFGLYAGTCEGTFNGELENLKKWSHDPKRFVRLDYRIIVFIYKKLMSFDDVKTNLHYYVNNTVIINTRSISFVSAKDNTASRRYTNTTIIRSRIVDAILNLKGGKYSYSDILNYVKLYLSISDEACESEIDSLIEIDLLISTISPSLGTKDYFNQLLDDLKQIFLDNQNISQDCRVFYSKVLQIENILQNLNCTKIGSNLDYYQNIIDILKTFGTIDTDDEYFHVELVYPNDKIYFNYETKTNIIEAFNYYRMLSNTNIDNDLEYYKDSFTQRYDTNKVPLLELMDPITGLFSHNAYRNNKGDLLAMGLGSVFNENLNVDSSKHSLKDGVNLLRVFIKATKESLYSIDLAEHKFTFDQNQQGLTSLIPILVKYLSSNDTDQYKIQFSMGGFDSPMAFISRFIYGSPYLCSLAEKLAFIEAYSLNDHKLAEIVHIPGLKVSNIIDRPIFRELQIPIHAESKLSTNNLIKLEDMLVYIEDNKFVVEDRNTGDRIMPVSSNAHNYKIDTIPYYRFLSSLYVQNKQTYFNIDWSFLSGYATFFPRIAYKDIVISPATWIFKKVNFPKFNEFELDDFEDWRVSNKVPDKIYICEDDNELFVDFIQESSVFIFNSYLNSNEFIVIKEALVKNDALVDTITNETYLPELVMFLNTNNRDINSNLRSAYKNTNSKIENINRYSYLPFDRWMYIKLYCNAENIDYILINFIQDWINKLVSKELVTLWFYIRYSDPDPHIRIRFLIKDEKSLEELLVLNNECLSPLLQSCFISNVNYNTFKPEVDRYKDLDRFIRIFYYDSVYSIQVIKCFHSNLITNTERLYYIAFSSYRIFLDADFSTEQIMNLSKIMIDSFDVEFQSNNIKEKEISKFINSNKDKLENIFKQKLSFGNKWNDFLLLLEVRSNMNKDIFKVDEKRIITDAEIIDIVHMHIIRLTHLNREFEWMVYKILFNYAKSIIYFDNKS